MTLVIVCIYSPPYRRKGTYFNIDILLIKFKTSFVVSSKLKLVLRSHSTYNLYCISTTHFLFTTSCRLVLVFDYNVLYFILFKLKIAKKLIKNIFI